MSVGVTYTKPIDLTTPLTVASAFGPIDGINGGFTSHMKGDPDGTVTGVVRHSASHIKQAALTETVTLGAALTNPGDQGSLNNAFASAFYAFIGANAGTGWAGRVNTFIGKSTAEGMLALLQSHDHSDSAHGGKLAQANTHQSADTDGSAIALHHTLGTGAFQAAAGNHLHAGVYLPVSAFGAANGVATLDASSLVPLAQISSSIARVSDLASYVAVSTKGVAGGVATLDGTTTVPIAQIPATIARTANVSPVGHVHGVGSEAAITSIGIGTGAVQNQHIGLGQIVSDKLNALWYSPASGGGNALKVTVNAWQGYNNGAWINFPLSNSPAIDPTGIAGGQYRIDLLVINTSNVLAWVVGTPGVSPTVGATDALRTAGTTPIVFVKVYPSAASITGYVDTGSGAFFVAEGRALFGGIGGSGGSGASSALHYATFGNDTGSLANSTNIATKPVVTYAVDADFTQELNLATYLAGGYIGSGTALAGGYTPASQYIDPRLLSQNTDNNTAPASPLDVLAFSIQQDIPARLSVSGTGSGTVASLSAGTGGTLVANTKHSITLYGSAGLRTRTITAVTSTPALGVRPAGIVYLMADLTTPNVSTYTLIWSSSPPAQYQAILAEFVYDGSTNLYWKSGGGVTVIEEYGGLGTLDAQRVRLNRVALQTFAVDSQATINTAVYAVPANCPRASFTISEPKLFLAFWRAQVTVGNNCTQGQFLRVGIAIDDDSTVVTNQYAPQEFVVPTFTGASVTGYGSDQWLHGTDIITLSPSSNAGGAGSRVHTLSMYAFSNMTSVSLFNRTAYLIPFAA